MDYIIKNKLKADNSITTKWEQFSSKDYVPLKSYTVGTPLLGTAWDQNSPYNNNCPLDPNTGEKCLVGCTAVALGQILNYWNCSVFPDRTRTYYPNIYFTNPLSVNFYDQDYDWDNMTTIPSVTAEFLYHCGVAIGVNYTDSATNGASNNVRLAMENNFGFQTMGLKSKNNYSPSDWTNMLKADINAGRPIYYDGTNTSVNPAIGHAWVIDGYKATNEFHCNWGWGGDNNDWYYLTGLTPPGHNYNSDQNAIIGAEPILDGCGEPLGPDLVCSSDVSFSVNIPGTASIAWSKSASLNQVGVNTNPTYTVNASTSGTLGYVTAAIKNSQNRTVLTRTKEVWVGTPDHDNIMITGDDWVVPTNSIFMATASEDMYIDYYQWDLPYGFTITQGQGTNTIRFNAPTGFGTEYYGLQLHNTCGTIGRNYIMYEAPFKNALIITPNPTTGETTLSIESATEETQFDINEEWYLEIYNNNQTLKEKKTKLKGNEYHLNTSGWKDGVYMLRVNYKNEILTGKLVVKR